MQEGVDAAGGNQAGQCLCLGAQRGAPGDTARESGFRAQRRRAPGSPTRRHPRPRTAAAGLFDPSAGVDGHCDALAMRHRIADGGSGCDLDIVVARRDRQQRCVQVGTMQHKVGRAPARSASPSGTRAIQPSESCVPQHYIFGLHGGALEAVEHTEPVQDARRVGRQAAGQRQSPPDFGAFEQMDRKAAFAKARAAVRPAMPAPAIKTR
jgi:hypothetical protein